MAVQSRIVLEPPAPGVVDATSTPPFLYAMSRTNATRAAIAQATAFLRQALGTE